MQWACPASILADSLWTTASYCQLALVPVSDPIHATAFSRVSNSAHQCCKNVAGGCSIATTKLLEHSHDLIAAATSLPSRLAYPGFCILQASCMHILHPSSTSFIPQASPASNVKVFATATHFFFDQTIHPHENLVI